MLRTFVCALALLGSPATAQEERLSGDEFSALVTGRTLSFSQQGQPYGAEEYRRDRSVLWSFANGECQHGFWSEGPDETICFVYEDRPDRPICWEFFRDGKDFKTRVLGADPERDLTVTNISKERLQCQGPDVGV